MVAFPELLFILLYYQYKLKENLNKTLIELQITYIWKIQNADIKRIHHKT